MNETTPGSLQRFEPNPQLVWGQVLFFALLGAVTISLLDYFKLALERSLLRAAWVAGGAFMFVLVIYWFRTGRHGCQTVVLDEKTLMLETRDRREVLPWTDLSEIFLVGDSVLKFQSRNAREALRLDNLGFTLEQWKAIKEALLARGYQFKMGYSAL
jgi:hypothetical protein